MQAEKCGQRACGLGPSSFTYLQIACSTLILPLSGQNMCQVKKAFPVVDGSHCRISGSVTLSKRHIGKKKSRAVIIANFYEDTRLNGINSLFQIKGVRILECPFLKKPLSCNCKLKSFESRLTIFLSYSFIQRARAGALVLVSLHLP